MEISQVFLSIAATYYEYFFRKKSQKDRGDSNASVSINCKDNK